MSPRSRTVGPGSSPSSTATTDDDVVPVVTVSGRPSSASRIIACVPGSSRPELGSFVDAAPQVDGFVQLRPGLVQHPAQHVSHGRTVLLCFCVR